MHALVSLLLIAALGPLRPAWAAPPADTWVDPVGGDDGNTGSSPNDALRTLTRALRNTAGSVTTDTIWLLPGTYSAAASGETFPILVRLGEAAIRSTAGPEATVFDVGGGNFGLRFFVSSSNVANAHLSGVSVRNSGGDGIDLEVDDTAGQVTLESVRVRDCRHGISLFSDGFHSTPVLIRDAEVEQCMTGLFGNLDTFFASQLIVRDCRFEDCAVSGIRFIADVDSVSAPVLERVRVLDCGSGISFSVAPPGSPLQVLSLLDCLIAGHQIGIQADPGVRLDLTSCTVAANATFGIRAVGPVGTIDGSIVWSNGTDLDPASGWQVTRSNVGTPGYAPGNGNVSVDPLFRDPGAGDFRLGSGTACIDGGAPSAAGIDLDGDPRAVDGDLDLAGLADMGALELQVLDGPPVARPGDLLRIEIHGEDHKFARLVYDPMGLLQAPLATPLGELWIDPATLLEGGLTSTAAGAPSTLPFQVAADPALIGLTFGLQAFVRSSNTVTTAALSNPIEILIVN